MTLVNQRKSGRNILQIGLLIGEIQVVDRCLLIYMYLFVCMGHNCLKAKINNLISNDIESSAFVKSEGCSSTNLCLALCFAIAKISNVDVFRW